MYAKNRQFDNSKVVVALTLALHRIVLICATAIFAVVANAAGDSSMPIGDVAVPPIDGSLLRIDSSHERWNNLKTIVSEGPIRCLPKALFAIKETTVSDSRVSLEFGIYGVGQNFLELYERWSQRSFAEHLSLLDLALTRAFKMSVSRASSRGWEELSRNLTQTHLSFGAVKYAKETGGATETLMRCEHYFCIKGRGVCAFYEKRFINADESVVKLEFQRQKALLETWAADILMKNEGIQYVDNGTSEEGFKHVRESLAQNPSAHLSSARVGMSANKGLTRGWGVMICIVVALVLLTLRYIFRHIVVDRDVIDVDQCLRSDRDLKRIVTHRMLEEWSAIVRYFSSVEGPRTLCVPAMLFLWEKIFEPKMPHVKVLELEERIRCACGLDRVFSKKNFESVSAAIIKANGYEAAWRNWQALREYRYSITERIVEGEKLEMQKDFSLSVYRLLKSWDGKFDCVTAMLPVDWKLFFKNHPELAEHDLLVRYGVLTTDGQREALEHGKMQLHRSESQEKEGKVAFLDAGKDGILRAMLWKSQQKVVLDVVSCRLYLPKDWNVVPEVETLSPHDSVVKIAGPKDHEWFSVERLQLSPQHVNDDLGDWINMSRLVFGKLNLQPPRSREGGVDRHSEVLFARLDCRDALFMKYHAADDMAAFVGMIEIMGRLYRLVIVIVRRGAESWKFEYVFPAADGVTKEVKSFRPEELSTASQIFVPIETFGRTECSVCGEKMDDPDDGSNGAKIEVWMKGFFLFDDMQVPKAGVGIPCCASCREKILASGVSKLKLEAVPAIRDQMTKGASILEVKCGADTVQLLEITKSDAEPSMDGGVLRTESTKRDVALENDRAATMKKMLSRNHQLVDQIQEAEARGYPIDELVKECLSLLGDFRVLYVADAKMKNLAKMDRVSGEIKIVSNMKALSKKIGLPIERYDREIFDLRCQIFAPEAVRQIFHDEK